MLRHSLIAAALAVFSIDSLYLKLVMNDWRLHLVGLFRLRELLYGRSMNKKLIILFLDLERCS